jgi:hypothetical protein
MGEKTWASSSVLSAISVPMAAVRASAVRAAPRRCALSLAKANSIGVKSGE